MSGRWQEMTKRTIKMNLYKVTALYMNIGIECTNDSELQSPVYTEITDAVNK